MFFFQAEDGIRDLVRSRGLGDVYKRQAQCHVEYYFKKEGNYLTFPWDKGFSADDMEIYYDEYEFTDWTHKLSKAPMLKAQHPDYELFMTGVCLLYTSDAADERSSVDLGGRRIIKKKKRILRS